MSYFALRIISILSIILFGLGLFYECRLLYPAFALLCCVEFQQLRVLAWVFSNRKDKKMTDYL